MRLTHHDRDEATPPIQRSEADFTKQISAFYNDETEIEFLEREHQRELRKHQVVFFSQLGSP